MSDQLRVDERSEKNIATLHPKVQALARQLVIDAAAKNIIVKITSAQRSYEEQNALYRQARDRRDNDGDGRVDEADEQVTKAPAGYSNHNFGLAIDVTLFRGGQPVWTDIAYDTVGELGRALGFEWGGDWSGFVDKPHFQLRPDWARGMKEKDFLAECRRRHDLKIDVFDGGPGAMVTPARFVVTRREIGNRGRAPIPFLSELVKIIKAAPADIFERRPDPKAPNEDIYTKVKPILGPWRGETQRRAVACVVLWVLGGLESSWNQKEGRDIQNATEITAETMSAGRWQVSYNSRRFGQDLRDMLAAAGVTNGKEFQAWMKADDMTGAALYTFRLLRYTDEHHGPVARGTILQYLSLEAVLEFERLLS